MPTSLLIAWRQLSFHKAKLAAAVAGVVAAVMLMLVQLGIRQGAIDNSVAIAKRIDADIIIYGPKTQTIFEPSPFARVLLHRVSAHEQVEAVREVYISKARFRNPWNHQEHPIQVFGIEPDDPMFRFPQLVGHAAELRLADRLVFDSLSRRDYGPVAKYVNENGTLETEINQRKVYIVSTVPVGVSISSDGNVFMSLANFLRIFPSRKSNSLDLGLIRLKPGADRLQVLEELRPYVGNEAKIATREQLIASEEKYLRSSRPVDFIFGMGVAVGFFIGFVVVYQILYSEVTNHLPQFATLKAMGYTNGFLVQVVVAQSFILSILGYWPGFVLAVILYRFAERTIQMPFVMTWQRAVSVLALTIFMCGMSAMIAVRKAQSADPADVF